MSSTKKKTIKVRLFTMIFMIRDLGCDVADARNALFGPKVYATYDEAIEQVFNRVSARIMADYSDEFVSAWQGSNAAFTIDPKDYVIDDIDDYFVASDAGEKRSILNWFFSLLNTEGYEALFSIDAQELTPAHVTSLLVA